MFDLPFDYEAFAAADGLIGHAGIVVFDDTVDMAKMARFAMEFCAAESCGKCTPCRIGSTRGLEVIDRIIAGEDVAANRALVEDLCETMKFGSLCALGGFYPLSGTIGAAALSRGFRRSARRGDRVMTLIRDIDRGTPASPAAESVTLTIDGASVTVPAGTSIMRAASLAGTDIPKLCATDNMKAFGSCRICLVEIEGRAGTPASCTTPVAQDMVVRTSSERIDRLRKGVMELYLSDHPAPEEATEMREMADMIGVAQSRYLPIAGHLGAPCDISNPISTSIRPNASSVRAACGPATKSRARSP